MQRLHDQREAEVRTVDIINVTFRQGGRLYLFGNGGSAELADHVAAELVPRGKPAVSLCSSAAVLTAIANDLHFEDVFAEQVRAQVRTGDVAVGLSTSGMSANVQRGLAMARQLGAITIGCTAPRELADVVLEFRTLSTEQIQEKQLELWHRVSSAVI